jgi:integral membrane protein
MLGTSLGRLRLIGNLEGLSFLVLLGIAMPLKHIWHNPEPVRFVGMLHGVLFIAFVFALMSTSQERAWPWKRTAFAFASSLVPFGTFVLDRKLKEEERSIA